MTFCLQMSPEPVNYCQVQTKEFCGPEKKKTPPPPFPDEESFTKNCLERDELYLTQFISNWTYLSIIR